MKTYILKSFIAISVLQYSCSNNISTKNTPTPDFIQHYTKTKLPVIIRGCKDGGLPLLNNDSMFAKNAFVNDDGSIPYCTFQTNGDYYGVIKLSAADCAVPILITYDKTGNIIDEKTIAIGYCGGGPGFHCEEFASIKSDFSIYTSDTIMTAEIDSMGNEIKETNQNYIIYKKGRLLESGKIELTDTIRELIRK